MDEGIPGIALVDDKGAKILAMGAGGEGYDENQDNILRIYASNVEKMKTWKAPKAEKL